MFAAVAALVFTPLATIIALLLWLENGVVTRVGRRLRRTGLDELAQFINVWRGDMSIAGPRPLTAEDITRLRWSSSAHDWRFVLKPGITGLAYRNGWPQKQMDGRKNAQKSQKGKKLDFSRSGSSRHSRPQSIQILPFATFARFCGQSRSVLTTSAVATSAPHPPGCAC